jgi:hypothetical protein
VTTGCTKRGRWSDANAIKGCRYGIYLCIILESHLHGDKFSVQVGPINHRGHDGATFYLSCHRLTRYHTKLFSNFLWVCQKNRDSTSAKSSPPVHTSIDWFGVVPSTSLRYARNHMATISVGLIIDWIAYACRTSC